MLKKPNMLSEKLMMNIRLKLLSLISPKLAI